ncbi:MAG: hypothetical protein HN348_22355, partial [Proteobacteria bacterium]|nr:hypothetical protein [Pseudomonadota bacterium]
IWSNTLEVSAPGLEYFFRAVDLSDYRASNMLPEGGGEAPFSITVAIEATNTPFYEDFDAATSEFSLYRLGWAESSEDFAGYAWRLSQTRAHSAQWSVVHGGGSEEQTTRDWLVSPALDLTDLGNAGVIWHQYGPGDVEEDAIVPTTALYVSTGSPHPLDGDFTKVADVNVLGEEGWHIAQVVDLVAYSQSTKVYLAWYFEGSGFEWYIDDVVVDELGADVRLEDVEYTRVDPGTGTTITATLRNVGAPTEGDLIVNGEISAGNGQFGSPFNLGVVSSNQEVTAGITLFVDEHYPDNTPLSYTLVAEDDDDRWEFAAELVVGSPTVGHVQMDTLGLGLYQVWLGAGDPHAPKVEIPLVQSLLDTGSWVYEVDLTNETSYLPPSAGDSRWWVKVEATESGSITEFSIDYDGVVHESSDLGTFDDQADYFFYLPSLPQPEVLSSLTDPDPITPASIVQWELQIVNNGGDTVGLTTGQATTSDSGVIVYSNSPVELADEGWNGGATGAIDVSFGVDASRNDDKPIWFDVVVEDEAQTYSVQVALPVPSAVLVPTKVEIDDSAGNDDQMLDAGETAEIEVQITNMGSLDTASGLSCTLAQTGGAAQVRLMAPTDSYGFISSGSTKIEDDFEIEIFSGATGDKLDLSLTCDDNDGRTYSMVLDLVLGELPWAWLSVERDGEGDVVGDYHFDIQSGRFRALGDTMQFELVSVAPYDPVTLFIEAWMSSTGTPYDYYQLVAQSGVGTLRGYDNALGFTTLSPSPVVTNVDAHTVMVEVDLQAMLLVVDTVDIGFAAGFCPSTYYCDHYPDGWGDPYQTALSPDRWLSLDW